MYVRQLKVMKNWVMLLKARNRMHSPYWAFMFTEVTRNKKWSRAVTEQWNIGICNLKCESTIQLNASHFSKIHFAVNSMYTVIELMRDRPTKHDYASLKAYKLVNWKCISKGFPVSWDSGTWFWQCNRKTEREHAHKTSCKRARESEGEWENMRQSSKKNQEEQMGKSMTVTACMSVRVIRRATVRASASKLTRACRRRKDSLKRSVMSAINNRCRKLTCFQWTAFWPVYYRSQTQAKKVGLGALNFSC